MEIKDTINIAVDFSDSPGPRYITEGPWSGEEFLQNLLLPKFEKAVKKQYIILIDLDGLQGCPPSFISQSFGKLSQMKGSDLTLRHLNFKSIENTIRIDKIIRTIKDPTANK